MSNEVVTKNFGPHSTPLNQYCAQISVVQEEIQKELLTETLEKAQMGRMVGAPEVLQLGQNLITLIKGKRALDVGTFTGNSALAWALAIPEDGEVISMDVNHSELTKVGLPIIEKRPEIRKKIDFRLAPALETLGKQNNKATIFPDSLIAAGESGKWDFAFIDADKESYPEYYERCVTLLRSGGVIVVDNAFCAGGKVLETETSPPGKAVDAMNRRAREDKRVNNSLINLADGTHVIFKK